MPLLPSLAWLSDPRLLLFSLVLSLEVLLVQLVWKWCFKQEVMEDNASGEQAEPEATPRSVKFTIIVRQSTRFFALVTLWCISLSEIYQNPDMKQLSEALLIAYAIPISLSSIYNCISPNRFTSLLQHHLAPLLFIGFIFSFYTGIFPYLLLPRPSASLTVISACKAGLFFDVGVVTPLLLPHQGINEEETSSWFSLAFYEFLLPIIWKAQRRGDLGFDDFPTLAKGDSSRFVEEKSMRLLDPESAELSAMRKKKGSKKRHVFVSLLAINWWPWMKSSVLLVIKVLSDFSRPLAVQRIVASFEEADDSVPKLNPLVWAVLLFVGPVIGTLSTQGTLYISSRVAVQTESLLSQLIFKHTLRIRLSYSTSTSLKPSPVTGRAGAAAESAVDGLGVGEDSALISNDVADSQLPATKEENAEGDMLGKINNLIGSDLQNIVNGKMFLVAVVWLPVQFTVAVVFLFNLLSWSAFVGIAVLAVLTPLPAKVVSLMNDNQVKRAVATDERVGAITEALNNIRALKMFNWENMTQTKISNLRLKELTFLRSTKLVSLMNTILGLLLPLFTMLASLLSYTLLQRREIKASTIFSVVMAFDLLSWVIGDLFSQATQLVGTKVSLDRITSFFNESELLDAPPSPNEEFIGFRNASFEWVSSLPPSSFPLARNFKLNNLNLELVKGGLNVLTGPTGCGKSSLLSALLGEMRFLPGLASAYSLPSNNGVGYCPQMPWLFSGTIRDNIILAEPFDSLRFNQVIKMCSLERDLSLLRGGINTEVGEKGLTLSGGQKHRVSLARALYSRAEIVLVDDIFSALDVHTSAEVVDACFKKSNKITSGRTFLIASHHLAMLAPVTSLVVTMDSEGNISSTARLEEGKLFNPAMKDLVIPDEHEAIEKEDDARQEVDALVIEEEKETGIVSFDAYTSLLRAMGIQTIVVLLLALILNEGFNNLALYVLGYWAEKYNSSENVSVSFYLGLYAAIVMTAVICYLVGNALFIVGGLRASFHLHQALVGSILSTTFRFLDETPSGRIISRFTKDFSTIDTGLIDLTGMFLQYTIVLVVTLAGVILAVPLSSLLGVALLIVAAFTGTIYSRATLPVKRELSNAKSPVFNHLQGAVNGVVSIRAYRLDSWIKVEAERRIDKYASADILFNNLDRWVTVKIDTFSALFTGSLAALLIALPRPLDVSLIGLSLSLAVRFSQRIFIWVRLASMVQVESTSLERIHQYTKIPHEKEEIPSNQPPAAWPTTGDLIVENLSAKYSADGKDVLSNISFTARAGEKVAIVGRTGSGKSSLALSLLRLIPTSGKVLFDGLDTARLNLSALRSNMTIIPQDPLIFSGTIRSNLDPEMSIDDATLNETLLAAGLSSVQKNKVEKITLDTQVANNGVMLSQGERQIIALARALARRARILILDEATSNVDFEVDSAIQRSIRNETSGQLVLTIAHRLKSVIDYDRVIVLDDGKLVEFDSPRNLLERGHNLFSDLVEASGEQEELIKLVK